MGKLTNIRPRVGQLATRIKRRTDAEGHSAEREAWRAWYKTARWRDLRWATLTRDRFTCQCGCGHLEIETSLLVADHIVPHRGDPDLFWDPANIQTLWKPHHDADKQRHERRSRG